LCAWERNGGKAGKKNWKAIGEMVAKKKLGEEDVDREKGRERDEREKRGGGGGGERSRWKERGTSVLNPLLSFLPPLNAQCGRGALISQ
jgi:hypothetical protein